MAETRGFFVTGTDTGIGKTLVAAGLMHAFTRRGARVIGMKPVAAGCESTEQGLYCADLELLKAQANVDVPDAVINPYAFVPPIAPHIAAQQAGQAIDPGHIVQCYGVLASRAEIVVVEGVGGFKVPLTDREDTGDLARLLGLPVVLVVGMRLGCLNHALLAAQAIRAEGLVVAGWVANCIDPDMDMLEENIAALAARLACPLIGVVPYQVYPDPVRTAACLRVDSLIGVRLD